MFWKWLTEGAQNIWRMFSLMQIADVIDIICLAFLLYYAYKFIRDRRAGKLALGVLFIIIFLFLSELFEMHAMQFIFRNVFQVGMITLIIVFQPELRSALEKMGGESLKGLKSIGDQRNGNENISVITEVCEAVQDMSAEKTGALIVFERSTKLGDLILTGTVIHAKATAELIKNIFFNKAPLHDGALIIRDGRLFAAGCLLPLSSKTDITKSLGTRHRAAIGMSENSDAVVVVVSEETGIISVAFEGKLKRNFTPASLGEELKLHLAEQYRPTRTVRDKILHTFRPQSEKKNSRKGGKTNGRKK